MNITLLFFTVSLLLCPIIIRLMFNLPNRILDISDHFFTSPFDTRIPCIVQNMPFLPSILSYFKNCKIGNQTNCWFILFVEIFFISSSTTTYLVTEDWFFSLLSMGLFLLAVIDHRTMLLPDALIYPLISVVFIHCLIFTPENIVNTAFSALAGFLFLYSISYAHKLARGVHAIGFGDFKLFALLGAILGYSNLINLLAVSSIIGVFYVLTLQLAFKTKNNKIPFGPPIILAAWVIYALEFDPFLL